MKVGEYYEYLFLKKVLPRQKELWLGLGSTVTDLTLTVTDIKT